MTSGGTMKAGHWKMSKKALTGTIIEVHFVRIQSI